MNGVEVAHHPRKPIGYASGSTVEISTRSTPVSSHLDSYSAIHLLKIRRS